MVVPVDVCDAMRGCIRWLGVERSAELIEHVESCVEGLDERTGYLRPRRKGRSPRFPYSASSDAEYRFVERGRVELEFATLVLFTGVEFADVELARLVNSVRSSRPDASATEASMSTCPSFYSLFQATEVCSLTA